METGFRAVRALYQKHQSLPCDYYVLDTIVRNVFSVDLAHLFLRTFLPIIEVGTGDKPSGVHRSAGVFPLSLSNEEARACENYTFMRMNSVMLGRIASIAPSIA